MLPLKNKKITGDSRRQFIKKMIIAGSLFPVAKALSFPDKPVVDEGGLEIHIFSKHLQFLNYRDMAKVAAEIGFDGVDLTIRPGGHVLPKEVEKDLPRAVDAIRKVDLKASMMTTNVSNPKDGMDRQVLETASELGIHYYRMAYFQYRENESISESINHYQKVAERLSKLNKELEIVGCYQNHAGNFMGASMWELWQLLDKSDRNFLGAQYDIRHAMVEGWQSWKNGLRLIQPRIKTLAIKDFTWEKRGDQWHVKNIPIGEGAVDFKTYFQLLKEYHIQVPVSLHFEYPLGGAEHGAADLTADRGKVFRSMRRDLQKLRQLWRDA